MRWHIDECTADRISGWVDDDGPVDSVTVVVNGRKVLTLTPNEYRQDLEQAGFGDGRRSFSCTIRRHLVEATNTISIMSHGEALYSADLSSPPDAPERRPAKPSQQQLLADPLRPIYREKPQKQDCVFYHVADLADGTTTSGQWDLRGVADTYLGEVDFAGKRVIEVGPASGFLSFHMERQGAQVATIDTPLETTWDFVPQAAIDLSAHRAAFRSHIREVRNSFWYFYHENHSKVEAYEYNAYKIPPESGEFDIGVLASILLHISSPVKMMESVANLVTDQMIIVERYFKNLSGEPLCRLVPTAANKSLETWWEFSPEFFVQFLKILGFPHTRVTRHRHIFQITKEEWELFTVVGTR